MAKAGITEYKEDDIVLKQGDPDKSLYKILSGQVAVYINYGSDDEYLVGIQSFPSCFGEMTILSGQPSFYTVVALTETKILCVPEENFEALCVHELMHNFSGEHDGVFWKKFKELGGRRLYELDGTHGNHGKWPSLKL